MVDDGTAVDQLPRVSCAKKLNRPAAKGLAASAVELHSNSLVVPLQYVLKYVRKTNKFKRAWKKVETCRRVRFGFQRTSTGFPGEMAGSNFFQLTAHEPGLSAGYKMSDLYHG